MMTGLAGRVDVQAGYVLSWWFCDMLFSRTWTMDHRLAASALRFKDYGLGVCWTWTSKCLQSITREVLHTTKARL